VKVTIVGTGYVGLTSAVALAHIGHNVVAVDTNGDRLALLRRGISPIHEPGLNELLGVVQGQIGFFADAVPHVGMADVVLIAVGTPSKPNGEADTQYVEQAARQVANGMLSGRTYTVIIKSTVPIGSNRRVAHVMNRTLQERGVEARILVASNPEFLREGLALKDTLYPDRIVVGADTEEALDTLSRLYRPILDQTFKPLAFLPRPETFHLPALVTTDPTSAEMIKYAANAFLALKISFINEVAGLCEKVGADVTEVARGIGLDSRIGHRFLQAGLGWGGSCFPKDTAALIAVAGEYNYDMPIVKASREINDRQRHLVVEKLLGHLKVLRGRTIGVLGLAFKPNTDDVREAPALYVIRVLVERGAHVKVYDPVALANAELELAGLDIGFVRDPYEAARGCDAVVLATEWEQFREIDMKRLASVMRSPLLVDGRNFFDPVEATVAGFTYVGIGR
jgi:UDPglucose 6-dehydrogenase